MLFLSAARGLETEDEPVANNHVSPVNQFFAWALPNVKVLSGTLVLYHDVFIFRTIRRSLLPSIKASSMIPNAKHLIDTHSFKIC